MSNIANLQIIQRQNVYNSLVQSDNIFFHEAEANLYSTSKMVNILLHDHFEGCNEIANPKGQQFFIPRGEVPRDEKLSPAGFSNSIASRKMIVL